MRKLLAWSAAAGLALACEAAVDEIVVTRDQFGDQWPLAVNSARLRCDESGAVLRLGQKRYALDAAARQRGLPDAREVAARRPDPRDPAHGEVPADLAPLLDACEGLAHVASGR